MPQNTDHPERDPQATGPRLCPADAQLLDRLLAGEAIQPADDEQAQRLIALRRLLSVLDHWQAEDPDSALAGRTLAGVLEHAPVTLSAEDAEVLDAVLALRQRGLETGPMPADSRDRAERLTGLLALLDGKTNEQSVPAGLVDRTLRAVEEDRDSRRRLTLPAASSGQADGSTAFTSGSLRQIATTAALVLMSLSVLLPIMNKGREDAQIAQCGANLAGLGGNLDNFALDNDGSTDIFAEHFASSRPDGTEIPPEEVSIFVFVDQVQAEAHDVVCPSAPDPEFGYYNGQDPTEGPLISIYVERPRPILADTNPLYQLGPNGLTRNLTTNTNTTSINHGGRGQNVLIGDGSVLWMVRPTYEYPLAPGENGSVAETFSDNIWTQQTDEEDDEAYLTP